MLEKLSEKLRASLPPSWLLKLHVQVTQRMFPVASLRDEGLLLFLRILRLDISRLTAWLHSSQAQLAPNWTCAMSQKKPVVA